MDDRYDNGQALDEILKEPGKLSSSLAKRSKMDRYIQTKNIEFPCPQDGLTPLSRATMAGDLEVIQVLLEQLADPNIPDSKKGRTPMHYAAREGFTDIAAALISYGGNVNQQDHNGHTPLMYSTGKKNLPTVSFLIKNGADVNLQDKHGNTALLYAIKNADKDTMTHLIFSGTDMDIQNNKGFSASFLKEQIINLHEKKLDQIAQKQNEQKIQQQRQAQLKQENLPPQLNAGDTAITAKTRESSSTKFKDMVTKSRSNPSTRQR